MFPLMMEPCDANAVQTVSCDASIGTSGVTWPKHHATPSLDHLYLINAMVSSMILLVSHNGDAGSSGFTCPIIHV